MTGFAYYLRVAYLGTSFHGWQIQTHLRSVQRELWNALRAFDPEVPMPQGTGRTDAGVHAQAQGVLVRLQKSWEPYRLLAAANAHLPHDVRVMEAQPVPDEFFPRHHALGKRYVYRIQEGPAEDPFQFNRRWHVHGLEPLNRGAMETAAKSLLGEHDFSAFRHQECAAKSPVRFIHEIRLKSEGPLLDLEFEGNRFLMHQVRIMAGTLVEVGKGRIAAEALPDILDSRDRRRAGRTAPAHGLCLERVWYQSRWNLGPPCPWGESSELHSNGQEPIGEEE